MPLGALGTAMPCCQAGRANTVLTPPPVAPSLALVSFHTTSLTIDAPLAVSLVPPHASAFGLEAGKSTCGWPSLSPSPEPLSPAAAVTVTPSAAASSSAVCIASREGPVQLLSGPAQLTDITVGLRAASCAARESAS